MSEELVKQLSNYKAQLQQVEAALSTDPDNEDLLKLQKDLQVWGTIIHYFLFFSQCVHCWDQSLSAVCRIFQGSSVSHLGWCFIISSDKMKKVPFYVSIFIKSLLLCVTIGGDWVDKRPVDITACGGCSQHQKLRDSRSHSQLEGWRPLHGHLEPGWTVSITPTHTVLGGILGLWSATFGRRIRVYIRTHLLTVLCDCQVVWGGNWRDWQWERHGSHHLRWLWQRRGFAASCAQRSGGGQEQGREGWKAQIQVCRH